LASETVLFGGVGYLFADVDAQLCVFFTDMDNTLVVGESELIEIVPQLA
jgi:hypothetical protein